MPMIDISFDTYKHLTLLRAREEVTYDDVIRGLLKLPTTLPEVQRAPEKKAWSFKSITLPHGTELRANYKGKTYEAGVVDGVWMQNGQPQTSPSAAANAITGNSVNGWTFWEAKLPDQHRWRALASLR
ncbi:DUF4357 domain-containing protein [Rhizobium cauense]|uniref:DUF4357 domain-containing protein n=1 Tax=Rhizobium cauense TaxID=1166683 RepID=UPI001C6E8C4A|nr:DUF4357 domain-containing protein [Rhizobium cauense]MBW9116621.1 DUF4357 domain-containing protein [Rhizobium cauense]